MLTSSAARVLLVDLSQLERNALEDTLVAAGFSVRFALGHTDLCLKLHTWRPDLVLADADVRAGEAKGLAELVRTMTDNGVPIFFISGQAILPELDGAVVPRPAQVSELLAVVRAALGTEAPSPR